MRLRDAARQRWWMHSAALCALLLLLTIAARASAATADAGAAHSTPVTVVTLDIRGAIGVATALQVTRAVEVAAHERATLILITLDTPGGLVSATRDIIQAILGSAVPVAVYVAPSGAHAASAGTYILYAAHVAAMAPGTSLGAATPVQIGLPGIAPGGKAPGPAKDAKRGDGAAGQSSAMERKVLNDALAFMRTLAQLRGRNAEWAQRAVRDAATLTATEAVAQNVADLLATSRTELLDRLDGRTVHTVDGTVTLATRGARLLAVTPDWRVRALGAIADPNVAFILLMVGIYGLLFELWHPGLGIAGTIGALCLLVAMVSLSVLPVHYGGLALLLLGVALMAGEAFTPGVGVLGLGGLAAFVLGAVFLFDPAGADIAVGVAWPLIAAAAVTTGILLVFVFGYLLRARKRAVRTGAEEMIGLRAEVRQWSGHAGNVHVHGESWQARGDRAYVPGEHVEVVARDGLTLVVRAAAVEDGSMHKGA